MTDKPKITLGTIEVTTPKTQVTRMSMIIWGPSGCGKTTIAATAPRPILWVNFDPDGTSSLMDQEDIHIADFSMENPNKVVTFKHENAGGIKQVLDDHPEIQTVVFDSITSVMADVTHIQCKVLCQ
jgi:alpha-D-ribose 1-methylphosphonate 5-triphosphate synthase subunit PhnL